VLEVASDAELEAWVFGSGEQSELESAGKVVDNRNIDGVEAEVFAVAAEGQKMVRAL